MTVKGALSLTNNQYQEAVKKAVRPKFRGNRPLPAKTTPQYPQSAEREYRRIAGAYMRLLNEELKKKLPAMMNEYKRERRGDSRLDDSRDLDARIRQMLQEVSAALEKRIARFGLDSKIQQIAKMTQNTSVREWKRAVKDTLGIDILDDYYPASCTSRPSKGGSPRTWPTSRAFRPRRSAICGKSFWMAT